MRKDICFDNWGKYPFFDGIISSYLEVIEGDEIHWLKLMKEKEGRLSSQEEGLPMY